MKTWIVIAASLVFSISAFADHHEGMHAGGKGEMKECRKQMMDLCKGKKRGPEMIQCMEENKSKMSAECQQKLDEKKELILFLFILLQIGKMTAQESRFKEEKKKNNDPLSNEELF